MKTKILLVPLLATVFLLQGCFSLGAQGGFTGSRNPSATEKAVAAAADVVTLPLQLGLVAAISAEEAIERSVAPKRVQVDLIGPIMQDPEYVFTQKLDPDHNFDAELAIRVVLQDTYVNFTDDQLRRYYNAFASIKGDVLRNPHCSEAFLREVYASLRDPLVGDDFSLVFSLVENPVLPIDLLETIAGDGKRFERVHGPAQAFLKRRSAD